MRKKSGKPLRPAGDHILLVQNDLFYSQQTGKNHQGNPNQASETNYCLRPKHKQKTEALKTPFQKQPYIGRQACSHPQPDRTY